MAPGASAPHAAGAGPAVAGVSNLRDFGGHATASGAAVARGRFWRSAHLLDMTAAGAGGLRALGIATVIPGRAGCALSGSRP